MVLWGNIPAIIATAGQSVDLERPGYVTDDMGGRVATFATVTAAIPAWVQPMAAATIEQYAARDIVVTHAVYFSSDPGAQLGDRFKFGVRYLLVQGLRDFGEVGKCWRVDCEESK
jgi:hypothetical protein